MTAVTIQAINLQHDQGEAQHEARRYARDNPEITLGEYLRLYPARTREPLPEDHLGLPLSSFLIAPVQLSPGMGVEIVADRPAERPVGELRQRIDELWAADVASGDDPAVYPDDLSDNQAVHIAYRHELEAVARFLQNDLSVLISCDKVLTEHIYEYVVKQAGKVPVLDDDVPEQQAPGQGAQLDRAIQGSGGIEANLPLLIRNLKPHQILVLRSVDLLDNPALIQVLYQGASGRRKSQLLGFLDPSLEVKKVLTDRFSVHVALMGLPRYIAPDPEKPPVHTVTRLITAGERQRFRDLDAEGLYKNVAGLNAVQFRNAMRYVGATLGEDTESRRIYELIRRFKTSSSEEIEIPDTTFDDIGGYDAVKQELGRVIALVAGRVKGISEQERGRLIPRGFIFHGPPGTGKTLFAKAIANEMNATIQMVSGPEIMDKYVGQSESNLRRIFATARRNAPSVIFFDEFDSLASERSTYSDGGARANNAVVAQLLTELDGFRQEQAVLVIGTTNRLDIIDEALLRPSRLRPIEIGRPDTAARKRVAHIHAESFGVDALLMELCGLVDEHAGDWQPGDAIPADFLAALFGRFPISEQRFAAEEKRSTLLFELREYFQLVYKTRTRLGGGKDAAPAVLGELEEKLQGIAESHGLSFDGDTQGDGDEGGDSDVETPMAGELAELFRLLSQERHQGGFSPAGFLDGIEELVAEYTEGFNNDEIRAIFQEASLEHHMEGRLITPRYLGMKIGMIRKRRDEREKVHLTS